MNEQISALADNEFAVEDAANLITAMQRSGSAAEAWEHCHLIGDVMRGADVLSPKFKQSLMDKIDLEPTVLSPNAAETHQNKIHQNEPQQLLKSANAKLPIAWSIAASFAAVIVVGWMVLQLQVPSDASSTMVAQSSASSVFASPIIASAESMAQAAVGVADASVPEEYLLAHQASAPTASSYYIQSASYSK